MCFAIYFFIFFNFFLKIPKEQKEKTMKFIFEKDDLLKSVSPAMGSVSSKSTLPAIEGILFTSKGENECEIVTYDLEKGYKTSVQCEVESGGSFILPADKIFQIVKTMPAGQIFIETNDKMLSRIYSGKSEFELHALPGHDFPSIPELNGDKGFIISQSVLYRMIRDSEFAVASNDPRINLNGMFFKIENNKLTVVSCDGNRMAIRKTECDIENFGERDQTESVQTDRDQTALSFIIPGKTVSELMRHFNSKDDTETVKIMLGRRHVILSFDGFYLFSRLIDGDYIEYDRYIPKNNKTFVTIDRIDLINSLERAALVTEDRSMGQSKSAVKLNFDAAENLLQITTQSVSGRVYDEVAIAIEGDGLEIGFNCRFLLDALRAAGSDTVRISMSSPFMSMIIEPPEQDDADTFLYMVLPVKM
jgi:DNA polymerase-3 subunit beta